MTGAGSRRHWRALALAGAALVLGGPAAAAGPELYVGHTTARPGDPVRVPLLWTGQAPGDRLTLTVRYPAALCALMTGRPAVLTVRSSLGTATVAGTCERLKIEVRGSWRPGHPWEGLLTLGVVASQLPAPGADGMAARGVPDVSGRPWGAAHVGETRLAP